MSGVTLNIQFDHRDGNLTYQQVKWERIPNIGETVHISDANTRQYIQSPFWTVAEISWDIESRLPRVLVIPQGEKW